jgi:hypothetical protein
MILALIGAFLISLGLFALFLLIGSSKDDTKVMITIIVCSILIISGGFLLNIQKYTGDITTRIIYGIISFLIGLFFTFGFPSTMVYQGKYHKGMVHAAILFGLTFLIFGVWLLFFG